MGGILCRFKLLFFCVCFKSYPRVGGICCIPVENSIDSVSSHTPAWGYRAACAAKELLTCFKSYPRVGGICAVCDGYRLSHSFKSYPRVGGIPPCCLKRITSSPFQVIPPRGGYHTSGRITTLGFLFQVIPPRGGYLYACDIVHFCKVSSHTPAWGVSGAVCTLRRHKPRFKSYPRVGGIDFILNRNHGTNVSSHTPAWGVSLNDNKSIALSKFQVIPPRGGYPLYSYRRLLPFCFKSYPRVGVSLWLCCRN